jgi:hypothetical protein
MKTEYVTLVAALLAAVTSITGIYLSQHGTAELERKRWVQTRQDEANKELRVAIADYARELSMGVQRASWLVWIATYDPEALSRNDFAAYCSISL